MIKELILKCLGFKKFIRIGFHDNLDFEIWGTKEELIKLSQFIRTNC